MVGSQEEAATALSGNYSLIGQGVHRNVYLSPTEVVYKVDKLAGDRWGNLSELLAYARIGDKTWGVWRVADMSFYMVDDQLVVASEYVVGMQLYWTGEKQGKNYWFYWQTMLEVCREFGLKDIHGDNFIAISPTEYVLVDIGD